jgi:hypothetical protein
MLHINHFSLLTAVLITVPWICYAQVSPPVLTYWISDSCAVRTKFGKALTDALIMARRGAERLSSTTDTVQQMYFRMIFKQDAISGSPPQRTTVGDEVFRLFNDDGFDNMG